MSQESQYTDEIAKDVCVKIMSGMSVREIGKQDDMPTDTCIFNWLAQDKGKDAEGNGGFVEQYTRAKEIQAEMMSEDILSISDEANNDYMERKDKEDHTTGWVLNGEHVQRSRLRVESRKWLMGKLKPKKYGDKITTDLNITDKDDVMSKLTNGRNNNANREKPED